MASRCPRLLDLFCGAGGAAMGYHRAGFDVDVYQTDYPSRWMQSGDLFLNGKLELLDQWQ